MKFISILYITISLLLFPLSKQGSSPIAVSQSRVSSVSPNVFERLREVFAGQNSMMMGMASSLPEEPETGSPTPSPTQTTFPTSSPDSIGDENTESESGIGGNVTPSPTPSMGPDEQENRPSPTPTPSPSPKQSSSPEPLPKPSPPDRISKSKSDADQAAIGGVGSGGDGPFPPESEQPSFTVEDDITEESQSVVSKYIEAPVAILTGRELLDYYQTSLSEGMVGLFHNLAYLSIGAGFLLLLPEIINKKVILRIKKLFGRPQTNSQFNEAYT